MAESESAARALTEEFWAAAQRRELVRPVCASCGRNFFTPQVACPTCLSQDWSYQPSEGRGVVHSATVVHKAPSPDFEVPYRLAVVDLQEGWTMLANLVEGPDERLPPVGAAVEVTWIEHRGRVLPAFREVAP
ncbi:MAG: Zn-ribbon domain-containing OB-fold protein [Sporichthyaceae bacterium]